MTRINMTKYGFVRWPEEDFSDDGNRFTCYKVGKRVRVSKLVYRGEAYIAARIDGSKLPYEVYSKLPHYRDLDALNGVSTDALTDEDLFGLVEACMLYEKEYTEAENSIAMPSLEEIRKQCIAVQAKRNRELIDINKAFGRSVVAIASKLTEWEWRTVKEYIQYIEAKINTFDPDKYSHTIFNTSRSINFCKPDCSELQDSYYYKWIMERINK